MGARDAAHLATMHQAAWPGWSVEWQQPQVSAALAESTNENVGEDWIVVFMPDSLPVWKFIVYYGANT